MKNLRGKIMILFLLVLLVLIYTLANPSVSEKENEISSVEILGKSINVEIADEYDELREGLMFRESLAEDSGMLFIFGDEEIRSFWMKNTLIPLDMIFIDENFVIVGIEGAVPCEEDPCPSYNSKKPAKYVLEVNAGYVKEVGIKIGDEVKFSN